MIASYRKKYYGWTKADGCYWLVTFSESKSEGFEQEDDCWSKEADPEDPEIREIFDVSYSFAYHEKDVPSEYTIKADHLDFDGSSVKLEVYKTGLPGWTREDQFTSSKRVPVSQLSDFKIIYTYWKHDGVFVKNYSVAQKVDPNDLGMYQKMFRYHNM